MSELVSTLRAIIRDELTRYRLPELALVTSVFPRDSDGSDGNHQLNLTLRGSGVELQRVPVTVARAGWSALPRQGDLVVVTFLDGDINSPIALGTVYDGSLRPPVAGALDVVYEPADDEDASVQRLHIKLPGGCTITYGDDKLSITSGGSEFVLEKDGDISIKSAGNLKLESQGDLSLVAQGKVSLEAQQDLASKGLSVTLEGQASTTVKGPSIAINGLTSFSPS